VSSSSTNTTVLPPDQKDNIPPPPLQSTQNEALSKPLSAEEIAEKELHAFLQELDADAHPSSKKYSRVLRSAPLKATPCQTQIEPSKANGPLSEQLLPTTMSCREAFDSAFYCNSFGGKFNDIYRFGSVKPCSEHWNKFWFCMRTRAWPEKEKETAVRDYYRKVEGKKYEGGSSEDIWKSREKMLGEGEAFNVRVEAFAGESDEEWNRMEQMRRENVRRAAEAKGASS
jgi:hypothetical protein